MDTDIPKLVEREQEQRTIEGDATHHPVLVDDGTEVASSKMKALKTSNNSLLVSSKENLLMLRIPADAHAHVQTTQKIQMTMEAFTFRQDTSPRSPLLLRKVREQSLVPPQERRQQHLLLVSCQEYEFLQLVQHRGQDLLQNVLLSQAQFQHQVQPPFEQVDLYPNHLPVLQSGPVKDQQENHHSILRTVQHRGGEIQKVLQQNHPPEEE
mmetsp:Transcript_5139/g.12289  ORF Transcript_5139/g.12289 Transcript_5139/m.12289 type:complete len:210 (-) Transcript_5139:146-775(-)